MNMSDAELSEKLKPLNKKTKIFLTLGDTFIMLMLFLAAVSMLLLFVVGKFGAILFLCSAIPCTIIAIIFKKIGLGYGGEMVQLTLKMAEG
ncbi:MAG: hypothetical protein LBI06_08640, partial [Treponema sp.]|nr:hypothetical protein [Treponema sp.]